MWLSGDLLAGIMLAAIALPEALATAKLAGFPLEAGVYAFGAGTLAFAMFGKNPFVSVGADSTIAPIFAASLGALTAAGGSAYHELAGVLALFVGAILIAVGVVRAGWVADLLSIPVTTGILAGIAVHIIVGQLPALLGIATVAGPLLVRLFEVVTHLERANPYSSALGVAVLLVTFAAARVDGRLPGALFGLVGAGIAVTLLDLRQSGVAVLARPSIAVPPLRLPQVHDPSQLVAIAPLALVVAAVCALQTSVVVRSFPSNPGGAEDPSGDFAAIGLGSIVAGFVGAFPVNASPPRTAIVQGAGGRSQLSGIVALIAVVTTIALFSHLATAVPQAALAGVLIFIAVRLFRLREIVRIARYSRREINLVIAGVALVVVLPIQTGMLLAIMLSLAHGVTLVMWPPSTQLFQIRGSTVWWPPTGEHALVDVPGIVVFAPAAPVNFTNADYIRKRLRDVVANARVPVHLLVIEGSGVTDIDYTGSQMLQATVAMVRGGGIDVALARLGGSHAQQAAAHSGLIAVLGEDHVFVTVQEAIEGVAQLTLDSSEIDTRLD